MSSTIATKAEPIKVAADCDPEATRRRAKSVAALRHGLMTNVRSAKTSPCEWRRWHPIRAGARSDQISRI